MKTEIAYQRFPINREFVSAGREHIESFMENCGFPDPPYEDCRLIAGEIFENVVKYTQAKDVKIQYRYNHSTEIRPCCMWISYIYKTDWFNSFTKMPGLDYIIDEEGSLQAVFNTEEMKIEGGRGLALIRNICTSQMFDFSRYSGYLNFIATREWYYEKCPGCGKELYRDVEPQTKGKMNYFMEECKCSNGIV